MSYDISHFQCSFHILINIQFLNHKIYLHYSKIMVYCATLILCVNMKLHNKSGDKIQATSLLGYTSREGKNIPSIIGDTLLEVFPDHPPKIAISLSWPNPVDFYPFILLYFSSQQFANLTLCILLSAFHKQNEISQREEMLFASYMFCTQNSAWCVASKQ